MTKITTEMISELYTKIKVDNQERDERIVYSDKYIYAKDDTTEKALYKIFSDVAYNSGLTYDFSFEVMQRVANVVLEMDTINTDTDISELVDNNTPVYNYDILKLYSENDILDDYIAEHGHGKNVVATAQGAYYSLIESLSREVMQDISDYNNSI